MISEELQKIIDTVKSQGKMAFLDGAKQFLRRRTTKPVSGNQLKF